MKILVIYTNTEIVSVEKVIETDPVSIISPESFICGDKDEIKSFFILKHFDVTLIDNLEEDEN